MFIHNSDNRMLIEVALGNRPADLVISNGTLMDVYTGRIVTRRSVAVSGQFIAYVGLDASHTVDEHTLLIDAGGRMLAPGYIDLHTHLANSCDLADLLIHSIGGGTTSFVSEIETYALAAGFNGIRIFLDQIRDQPVKIFCVIPPQVTLSPALKPRLLTAEQIDELLKEEMIIGLGESYWQNTILTADDRVIKYMRHTLKSGKTVQGHSAGASDRKLAAYAAAGAMSCHESVSPDDILARLEMGYFTILREGFIRKDLASLRPLIGRMDLRRCALCTDGVDPGNLLSEGYFVDVVQKAVDMGIPPIEALRMATLNPAEHLGLSHLIGALSPGRFADILLLPDQKVMTPELVISKGRIVAEAGRCVIPFSKRAVPDFIRTTLNIASVSPSDFAATLPCGHSSQVRTLCIQPNGLVAKEGSVSIPYQQQPIHAEPQNNFLKLAFIESVSGRGEKFVGFIQGWKQRKGALAASLAWDCAGIVAVGADDRDLALAVNAVIRMQGGVALAVDGAITLQIPFPVAGYISDLPIMELNHATHNAKTILQQLGVPFDSPLLSLVVLTSAAIPFIRITEKGYFRFRENDYVGL